MRDVDGSGHESPTASPAAAGSDTRDVPAEIDARRLVLMPVATNRTSGSNSVNFASRGAAVRVPAAKVRCGKSGFTTHQGTTFQGRDLE